MKCIRCNGDTKVIDTRPTLDRLTLNRRRECLVCQTRYNSIEITLKEYNLMRANSDPRTRQRFDRLVADILDISNQLRELEESISEDAHEA